MSDRRFISLDVLRGIAILGTLGTNIWIFTNLDGLVGYVVNPTRPEGMWAAVASVLQQLAQGKFLGLLTVMFGIGLAIQQASAVRRGQSWPGRYYWRAILLFVDGALNYLLFAEFDVLMGYAVTGLIVAYLLSTGIRRQRVAIAIAGGLHVLLFGVIVWALASAPVADEGSKPLSPNPYADGSFLDLILFRLGNVVLFRAEVVLILPLSIALFLIGAALLRAGVLEPKGAVLRRRLMVLGLGVAAPLDFAVGLFGGAAGVVFGRYLVAPFVALGVLAWVAGYYVDGRAAGRIGRALVPVGRTALSCYVLQNAIAGAICYGWGFGLTSRLDAATVVPVTVLLYLAICATMMIAAAWWLRRFERGPLEWLWHRGYDLLVGTRRVA